MHQIYLPPIKGKLTAIVIDVAKTFVYNVAEMKMQLGNVAI